MRVSNFIVVLAISCPLPNLTIINISVITPSLSRLDKAFLP